MGIIQSILVASDRYRKGPDTNKNAIALGKKLNASLRMAYVVDDPDLWVTIPGAPFGHPTYKPVSAAALRSILTAEGNREIREFSALCEQASIEHSERVYVGLKDRIWAERARSADLALILPTRDDFGRWARSFGAFFCRMPLRANRAFLIIRRNRLVISTLELFYSNRLPASRSLPWIADLAKRLNVRVNVHISGRSKRKYANNAESQEFFSSHSIEYGVFPSEAGDGVEKVLRQSNGSNGLPLLAFDSGYFGGTGRIRYRKLIDHLIMNSDNWLLLCP